MNFEFIKQLIDASAAFEQQHPASNDMGHFAQWLYAQTHEQGDAPAVLSENTTGETLDTVIGKLLIYLNRYAKTYTKKALEGTTLGSADEFVFLVYLHNAGDATKMELIEMARLEKPSGMEVIRRLLKMGYVHQEVHAVDKRSKNLRITDTGKAALFRSLEKMGQVSRLITGNLSIPEKIQLYRLLQQLEDFHQPIRKEGWEKLSEKSMLH